MPIVRQASGSILSPCDLRAGAADDAYFETVRFRWSANFLFHVGSLSSCCALCLLSRFPSLRPWAGSGNVLSGTYTGPADFSVRYNADITFGGDLARKHAMMRFETVDAAAPSPNAVTAHNNRARRLLQVSRRGVLPGLRYATAFSYQVDGQAVVESGLDHTNRMAQVHDPDAGELSHLNARSFLTRRNEDDLHPVMKKRA